MMLMRMQGETNRLETRAYIGFAVASFLAILALIIACVS